MLDSDTRRRIDTARDILVGKVPDPKSQVEQITIALIYKFMDDMDAEAEEMDGKRGYFVGEYEKFSWAKLLNPALSGYEMLNLYTEAMEKMTRNQGVPQLFRDIFKNAYLPYRDPETLKLFLKTINEFTYDHSERLGDAFEYLLSVLGSQGDAGQFRTPRHIIDFMVKVVDPKKDETILDPACGTAGFLISAYKHILANNSKDGKPGSALTPEDRKKLANNIRGYDISPDMVRLSLVNLYLHGFSTPHIYEYDTLTSEERWNEYADVILANPPFMSPKGGIKPHKRFSVQSNRSEVLFVDYMAEHLTMKGRAAIIVPEGIIFQSAGAYRQLRKYLVEQNYLWAVASLPAGVFNPYAGVKTSILFLDKALAKKTDQILFVKVEADGFDLGAQRRPIDRNNLPEALNILDAWKHVVANGAEQSTFADVVASRSLAKQSPQNEGVASSLGNAPRNDMYLLVSTSRLAENEDYNLSADRYREVSRIGKQTHPMVKLGSLCERIAENMDPTQFTGEVNYIGLENIESNTGALVGKVKAKFEDIKSAKTKFTIGDVLYGKLRPNLNKVYLSGFDGICSTDIYVLRTNRSTNNKYLVEMLRSPYFNKEVLKGLGGSQLPRVSFDYLVNLEIPLPPLEIQRQIVDEIAAHQRIIEGARQIVESWKYDIGNGHLSPEHETKVKDYVTIQGGFAFKSEWYSKDGIRLLRNANIGHGNVRWDDTARLPEKRRHEFPDYELHEDDILISLDRPIISTGLKIALVKKEDTPSLLVQRVGRPIFTSNKLLPKYFWAWLNSPDFLAAIDPGRSITVPHISPKEIESIFFAPPPLEDQREIVARIEREHAIVEGNRELIKIYEEKIKKVIERVWEG